MFKKTNSNNFFILFFSVLGLFTALYFHHKSVRPTINISKQDSATTLSGNFLRFISIGNKRLISNILWIQTLMESDSDHYTLKDKNNWMYLRFKTIHELDTKFYENYLYGGLFLSVIKNDVEAAADIYEKGLLIYPNDYRLNYNAGFNYYFEMGNFDKGLEKLEKVQDSPEAPAGLIYIINKLRFESSRNYDNALSFLLFSIQNTKDKTLLNKLTSDFYALKAQRDLECLNQNKGDCEIKDAEGNFYFKEDGVWKSQRQFNPYKIHLRQQ